jgi:hypothetical protein
MSKRRYITVYKRVKEFYKGFEEVRNCRLAGIEQSGPGARNTYSIICSYRIVDCCCSIEASYVVYIC